MGKSIRCPRAPLLQFQHPFNLKYYKLIPIPGDWERFYLYSSKIRQLHGLGWDASKTYPGTQAAHLLCNAERYIDHPPFPLLRSVCWDPTLEKPGFTIRAENEETAAALSLLQPSLRDLAFFFSHDAIEYHSMTEFFWHISLQCPSLRQLSLTSVFQDDTLSRCLAKMISCARHLEVVHLDTLSWPKELSYALSRLPYLRVLHITHAYRGKPYMRENEGPAVPFSETDDYGTDAEPFPRLEDITACWYMYRTMPTTLQLRSLKKFKIFDGTGSPMDFSTTFVRCKNILETIEIGRIDSLSRLDVVSLPMFCNLQKFNIQTEYFYLNDSDIEQLVQKMPQLQELVPPTGVFRP